MGMLSFPLDAGGDESTFALTVAGFGAGEKEWGDFTRLWTERLGKEDIAFFRAVDAAQWRGQFERFREVPNKDIWRKSLFSDLMEILKRHVYRKFGCTVVNRNLSKMDERLREQFLLTAFTLAGRTTEKQIREWIKSDWTPTTPVVIVMESGDHGKGKLQERLEKDGCFPFAFQPKKDTTNKRGVMEYGFVPLQAADWLAYELSLSVRQFEEGTVQEIAGMRWPMQQFHRILGEPGTYEVEDLREMERKLRSVREIDLWERRAGLDKLRDQRRKESAMVRGGVTPEPYEAKKDETSQ